MNKIHGLIDIARTINIQPSIKEKGFLGLFENTLVEKYFDINKVDILDLKKSYVEERVIELADWFKNQGAENYSKELKKKLFIFAQVVSDVMDVTITFSPNTGLYFIENSGITEVKNKFVHKRIFSRSLIYKKSNKFGLKFVISLREIDDISVLTGYFHNEVSVGEQSKVLFNFPIELANVEEVAEKFDFTVEKEMDFMGKDDLNEQLELVINSFKSGGIVINEELALP